jgi:hypothetical protein|tara:strand:- start:10132 stop:10311 length:180 start_codon:yes stop_codon:yes gene_type:complete
MAKKTKPLPKKAPKVKTGAVPEELANKLMKVLAPLPVGQFVKAGLDGSELKQFMDCFED